jgi:hypothetical protein
MVTIILRLVNPLVHGDGIKFIGDGRKLLAIFNGDIGGGNLSYLSRVGGSMNPGDGKLHFFKNFFLMVLGNTFYDHS